MLIEYGNTTVNPNWELNEETPAGYSRIYYVISGDVTYESAEERRALKPGRALVQEGHVRADALHVREDVRGEQHRRLFPQNSQMLTQVQQYIADHISEEMTIEQLSLLFNYHPNYFIRLFRRETGYTPYQYIIQQRMQYAVTQLNVGMPNDAVCYACGYTDSSTFTRAFRKYYGVAPQKYRKGFRKP